MPPPNGKNQNQAATKLYIFKVAIIGPGFSGKSALIVKYIENIFTHKYIETIGASFYTKRIDLYGQRIKTQFWDTAGAERFRSLMNSFTRGAAAVLITFDLTSKDTIALQYWIDKAEGNDDEKPVIIIVGNKSNSTTSANEEKLQALAAKHNLPCFMTNAETNKNVDKLFEETAKLCMQADPEAAETLKITMAAEAEAQEKARASATTEQETILARNNLIIQRLTTYITRVESNLLDDQITQPVPATDSKTNNSVSTAPLLAEQAEIAPATDSSATTSVPIEKINFAAGFWIMKESQAANRKANYLLAKQLLTSLDTDKKDLSVAFNDISTQRSLIISNYAITGNKNRGINSPELKGIIADATVLKKKL